MKKIFSILFFLFPTILFAQTYPLVSIHDLQYVDGQSLATGNDSSAIYMGDTVQVEGVVTFNPCDYGLSDQHVRVGTFIEDSAGGAWSGVHVLIDPGAIGLGSTPAAVTQLNNDVLFLDNYQYGSKVKATGIVTSFRNNTQIVLLPVQSTVTSFSTPVPAPAQVTIDSFMQSDGQGGQVLQITTGEKYEGVYVQFNNVRVVDVSVTNGYGGTRVFWSIQDAAGNKMKIRDLSGWMRNDTIDNFCHPGTNTVAPFDTPIVNSVLAFVKGVIVEYKSGSGNYEYYLAPLTLSDVGPTTYAAPTILSTSLSIPVPTTSQTQTVTATISDDQSVASAILYYTSGLTNNSFTPVTMTNTSGNIWQATIPAIGPDSTYVKYWIKATDNQGYYTNYPDSLGTNSFYLVKNAGITSLTQLNFHPLGYFSSPYANQTITNMNASGTVVSTTSLYDEGRVFIQDAQIPWSGIALKGSNIFTLHRGDRINITKAKVIEDFGVTSLDSVTFTVTSQIPEILPIFGIPMDSVIAGRYQYTEKYESMLLGFNTVNVVNTNPDAPSNFGEWSIYYNTSTTAGLRCDDESNDIGATFNTDSLQTNMSLNYIYGILTRAFSNWKLLPRNLNDIDGFHTIEIGIDEAGMQNNFWSIYPNPVSDNLLINYSGASKNIFVELFDATGRKVFEPKNNSATVSLNVQSLSAGTYFLQMNDGAITVHSKIVKLN